MDIPDIIWTNIRYDASQQGSSTASVDVDLEASATQGPSRPKIDGGNIRLSH